MGTKVDRFAWTECLHNSEKTKLIHLLFFDSKAVHFFFKTMFFLCRILCGRLTFQRIREASPNLFNDRCRSKSEKGHTPVNATVNQGGSKNLIQYPGSNFLSRWVLLNQPPMWFRHITIYGNYDIISSAFPPCNDWQALETQFLGICSSSTHVKHDMMLTIWM